MPNVTPAFLRQCRHWVFDMDGTLTCAVHDFDYIRQQLEIPAQADILTYLASLPASEAHAKHQWLLEHELKLAQQAKPAPGACALVKQLHAKNHRLAILTRNAHSLAEITLQTIGLDGFFHRQDILGREQAKPKPHPEGIQKIARNWGIKPQQLTMVGDFHFDLRSAQDAGARAVLVNTPGNLWPELTDFYSRDCATLLQQLNTATISSGNET